MPKNIIEKIWEQHVVMQKPGHPAVFAIDLMLIHEVTSAQAFEMIESKGLKIYDAGSLLATLDHSIPTRADRFNILDDSARAQVAALRANVKKFGVPFFDFDSGHQGIVHVIGPELGATQPGMTICCGDSHTSTHGAFGALAFGIGTSEVGHVLASGCLLQQKPKTMRVNFSGSLGKGVYAKDVILRLIAEIGIGGANGFIIEYSGPAIRKMSMEERMTICNMSIECGARAGLIAPDETTFAHIKNRAFAPSAERWEQALNYWRSLVSDPDATFDRELTIDLNQLTPMVTWGTNPGQAISISQPLPLPSSLSDAERKSAENAYEYIQLKPGTPIAGTKLDYAFLGSCTNGRIEDLRLAAKILDGRKVHPQVRMLVVPGSEAVALQAKAEGLEQVFVQAGAEFRKPGCSMCLGMNDDKVPPGKRCISSSNRNFVGRQGTGSLTHLASPATVAASAIEGQITSAEKFL